MRRFATLLILFAILLGGCAGSEAAVTPAADFRAALVQAGSCRFQAEITADYGDTVQCFTLECQADAEGVLRVTVLAPETIADITATVSEGGGSITYDGMALDFELLANGNVAPIAAPAIAVRCWLSEYIASGGMEKEHYRATYEKDFDEKRLTLDTWFENGLPFLAEVCYNEQRILRMTISDFSMN